MTKHQLEQLEKAKRVREEHKRACLMLATTFVVLGGLLGYAGFHGYGVVIEVVGLYLVALV